MATPKIPRKASRRRGRPSLPHGQGKRHALGLRVTAERREALEEAATSSGRSISQEIEFRLEQSFHEDTAFGGREMAALFRMMAGAATLISERQGGTTWSGDWQTFLAVRAAWREIIDQAAPDISADWKTKFQILRNERPGTPPAPLETNDWAMWGPFLSIQSDEQEWERRKKWWKEQVRKFMDLAVESLRQLQEIEDPNRKSALGRGLRLDDGKSPDGD